MKKDYVVLFILNAVGMILELVAARLLSPYFGNSNFVWTAIIGIILLAGSLGNLIGGKMANVKNVRFYMSMLLMLVVIYLALTPLVEFSVLGFIDSSSNNVQSAAIVSSIIFFLIPATILGIITPIVLKEHLEVSKKKGEESGRITAIIAIGSLVGTFAGGFFLIPFFGTKMIFVLLAMMVLLCVPMFYFSNLNTKKHKIIYGGAFIVAFLIATLALFVVIRGSKPLEEVGSLSIDTEYGRVIVEDGFYDGERVRFYRQSGAYSSATFLDEEKRFDLVFKYLTKYDEMFDFLDVKKVAMIGGAAYQYPKYYISKFPDKKMDVIEIDPMSTEIARKYFFLDELISEYDPDGFRLGLFNDDGRVFLAQKKAEYDAVLNDAFSGEVPVETLATVEAVKTIKNSLVDGGVYLSNVLGAVVGEKGRFLRAEIKTMKEVFRHVYIISPHENVELDRYANWIVIATDNDDYAPTEAISYTLSSEDLVLTDDYHPIENLIRTDYFEN